MCSMTCSCAVLVIVVKWSPKPEGLSNMQFAPCSVSLRCTRTRVHRRFWSKARLAANSPVCCQLTTPRSALHIPKRHLPSVEDSCQRHVGTRCIRCRCFLMLWLGFTASQSSSKSFNVGASGPSCHLVVIFLTVPCLHVLTCHFSTVPPVVSLQVWSHRFLFSPQKFLNTRCDLMGVPCSHESSKFVVVSAVTRIRIVLFHFPGHPVLLCFFFVRFSSSSNPGPVTAKESEIVTSSCMWL